VVEAIWERIEQWLRAHAPAVLASLNPPADPGRLVAAERHLGVAFPDDFTRIYLRHDGGGPGLFNGWDWLSLDGITSEWDVWKDLLDGGEFADVQRKTDGRTVPDWWHPWWIPFTSSGAGDNYCLDLNPGPDGTAGQVIIMWHDDAARPVEAESFRAWLARFADDLEAGRYTYSEEYGGIVRREDI
jgi:cell wall assembly regulator SMI1